MSDEKNGMPETLESLGQRIIALGKSIDARFAQVDARFARVDTRFDELKAQLRTDIEALDSKIDLVYDTVIGQHAKNKANDKAHEQLKKRLDDHETRILALERPKTD